MVRPQYASEGDSLTAMFQGLSIVVPALPAPSLENFQVHLLSAGPEFALGAPLEETVGPRNVQVKTDAEGRLVCSLVVNDGQLDVLDATRLLICEEEGGREMKGKLRKAYSETVFRCPNGSITPMVLFCDAVVEYWSSIGIKKKHWNGRHGWTSTYLGSYLSIGIRRESFKWLNYVCKNAAEGLHVEWARKGKGKTMSKDGLRWLWASHPPNTKFSMSTRIGNTFVDVDAMEFMKAVGSNIRGNAACSIKFRCHPAENGDGYELVLRPSLVLHSFQHMGSADL